MNARKIYSCTSSSTMFKLNIFLEKQILKYFRFKTNEIGTVVELIRFTIGKTTCKNCYCNDSIAAYIVLRRSAKTRRWSDLEHTFGLRVYTLSKIFWEPFGKFCNVTCTAYRDISRNLMKEREQICTGTINSNGDKLDKFVGFKDGKNIQMKRPCGPEFIQRAVYSG